MDRVNVPAKFSVRIALPVPEIIAIAGLGWGCELTTPGRGGRSGQSLDTPTILFLANF